MATIRILNYPPIHPLPPYTSSGHHRVHQSCLCKTMHHRFFSCVNAFDTLATLFRVIRVLSVLVGHRVPNTESECEMRELQTLTLETGTNAKIMYFQCAETGHLLLQRQIPSLIIVWVGLWSNLGKSSR